jgi:hypothetical protein
LFEAALVSKRKILAEILAATLNSAVDMSK